MGTADASRPSGPDWRRRVRRLTAGAVGVALAAAGAGTALLATGDDAAATTSVASSAAGAAWTPPSSTGTTSGSLTAPAQAPTRAVGSGHGTTGGS